MNPEIYFGLYNFEGKPGFGIAFLIVQSRLKVQNVLQIGHFEDTFGFRFTFRIVQYEIHITLKGVTNFTIQYTRKK